MAPATSSSAKLNSTACTWPATSNGSRPARAKPAFAGAKRNKGLRVLISIEFLLRGQITSLLNPCSAEILPGRTNDDLFAQQGASALKIAPPTYNADRLNLFTGASIMPIRYIQPSTAVIKLKKT